MAETIYTKLEQIVDPKHTALVMWDVQIRTPPTGWRAGTGKTHGQYVYRDTF
jgi:hypothetical protein